MYNLKVETKRNIENFFQGNFHISYEEYSNLPEYEKRKLINKYQKKHKLYKRNKVLVMIGSGEHAIFRRVKKGEKVWITSGNQSCFVRAGITPEESRRRLDDRLDDAIYSKPVAFVKKLQRRLKRH